MRKKLIPVLLACLALGGCGGAYTNEALTTNEPVTAAAAALTATANEPLSEEMERASKAIAYLEEIPAKDVRTIINEYERHSGDDIIKILSEGTEEDMRSMRIRFAGFVADKYAEEVNGTSMS